MPRKRSGQKHEVDQFTIQGDFVKRWESATSAAKHFGTSQGNISNAARGERSKAQGFCWRYVEEDPLCDEIWKWHPTLPFRTSNLGRVEINDKYQSFGQALRDGYYRIRLGKQPNRKNYSVHRLVAETWYPDEKLIIEKFVRQQSTSES